MLTARDAVADRVAGLDAGADDYLVKPFAIEELVRARPGARPAGGAAEGDWRRARWSPGRSASTRRAAT